MIKVESIDINELRQIEKDFEYIPIWNSDKSAFGYSNKEILIIKDNNIVKGYFVLPLYNDGKRITAEREYRVYPYASPVINEKDNMKRRKYVYELFKYIKSKYPLIELPLHYDFKDIAAIQTLGIFVEMWHTHITRKKLISKDISPSLRYNTSYASRFVNIKIDKDYSNFDFSQAIHGTKEEIKLRSENAINLINDNKAIIVSAYDNKTNKKVAATIISYDKKCAYYLHCYREKDSIRGVVPLMILKAIDYAFDELKIQIFDFEGAVIQGIDKFLSTFNVEIVPYGYLYYAKDKEEYKDLVFSTIDIEGRIENE